MNTKLVMLKFIFLSVLLFSITFSASAQGVKGQVLDVNTGEPLVGATVSIDKQSTYVKLDGTFQFKNLGVGKYTIKVTYTGYVSEVKDIQITSATETKVVDINLRSTSSNLNSVTVTSTNRDNDNSIRRLEKLAERGQ